MRRVLFFFLIMILITIPALAEEQHYEQEDDYTGMLFPGDSLNITLLGGDFSGRCMDVIVKDTIAFMGNGGYLTILNVSDKSNPIWISNTKVPGVIEDIDWEPGQIFVSIGTSGVVLVDVSDISNPSVVSAYDPGGFSYGLDAVDTLVYVAKGSTGFSVINFSNTSSPTEIALYFTAGYCRRISIIDTIGYISCSGNGLEIINVSNIDSIEQISVIDSVDFVMDAWIEDTLAYLADDDDGLRIWNVSDLSNPISIGTYYLGSNLCNVTVRDSVAYLSWSTAGLVTVNVSDPTNPTLWDVASPNDYIRNTYIQGQYAYCADENRGLSIYDITDPNNILEESNYTSAHSVDNIVLNDSLLFVSQVAGGFRIYSIVDPQSPRMLADLSNAGNIRNFAVDGNVAYLIGTSYIKSYDVSNPSNPVPMDTIFLTLPFWGQVRDTLLYGAFDNGVRILNIADPSNMTELGSSLNYSNTKSIELVDTFAYTADTDSGVVIYSVNDPANPYVITSYDPGGYTVNVTVKDTLAFVCEGNNDLTILSIANLDSIYELSTLNLYYGYHAQIVDTLLFIANSSAGVSVYNVSNPGSPVEVAYYETGNAAECVIVDGNVIYLADNDDGFYIFKYPMDAVIAYDLFGTVGLSDAPADSSGTLVEFAGLGISTTTDSHGYYEFNSISPGVYNVVYTHAGYEPDTSLVSISWDTQRDVTLSRIVNYYNITGTVGLSDNPADSSNTFISLIEASLMDTTDMHGYYEFLSVEEGIYTLIYWHDTYQGDTIIDTLDGNHVIDLTLTKLAGIKDYMNMPVISNLSATDHIEFLYSKKVEGVSNIGIYDVTGRNIYSSSVRDMGLYSISTGVMPQGVYFLHIKEGDNTYKRKVSIIK